MLILVFVFTIVWAATAGDVLGILGLLGWIFSLAWYTTEWITCGTRRFLSNQKQEVNVYQFVEQLRRAEPSVEFSAYCWHMETRTRLVTRTDGRGKTYTATETYQQLVVTHSRTEEFSFGRWQDATAELPRLDGCDMTKLYLTQDYACMDDETKARHDAEFADFIDRTPYDPRDTRTFEHYVLIPGFEARTLCYVDEGGPPPWVNLPCFILASLLFCTLPYRMALDRHVAEQGHGMFKLIGN